jgi:hypothetical protein
MYRTVPPAVHSESEVFLHGQAQALSRDLRKVSLWTKETAEDIRLKEALDRSAPCPWVLWVATYVDDDDADDDEDMLPKIKIETVEFGILCRNSRIWKTAIHAACRRPRV